MATRSIVTRPATPREKFVTAREQRSLLVDIVKGLAILLVVIGHTNQGIGNRQWDTTGLAVRIDAFIYSFHMPAFFFVSGIFLVPSVEKRGLGRFTTQKLRTILYPYLLWGLFLPLIPLLLGHIMISKAPSTRDYFLNLVTGNGEWFLPTLFVALLLGALLRKVPLLPLFAASVLVEHFWRPLSVAGVDRALHHFPFVVAGMWVGSRIGSLEEIPRVISAVLSLVAAVALYFAVPARAMVFPSDWRFVPVGVLGTAMLLFLARALGQGRAGKFFAWTGVASLGIYLLAPFPQGLGRELLLRTLHTHNYWLHLIVPSALAFVLPAWIYQHRVRLHMDWLFTWPRPEQSAARPSTAAAEPKAA